MAESGWLITSSRESQAHFPELRVISYYYQQLCPWPWLWRWTQSNNSDNISKGCRLHCKYWEGKQKQITEVENGEKLQYGLMLGRNHCYKTSCYYYWLLTLKILHQARVWAGSTQIGDFSRFLIEPVIIRQAGSVMFHEISNNIMKEVTQWNAFISSTFENWPCRFQSLHSWSWCEMKLWGSDLIQGALSSLFVSFQT